MSVCLCVTCLLKWQNIRSKQFKSRRVYCGLWLQRIILHWRKLWEEKCGEIGCTASPLRKQRVLCPPQVLSSKSLHYSVYEPCSQHVIKWSFRGQPNLNNFLLLCLQAYTQGYSRSCQIDNQKKHHSSTFCQFEIKSIRF